MLELYLSYTWATYAMLYDSENWLWLFLSICITNMIVQLMYKNIVFSFFAEQSIDIGNK